MNRKKYLYLFLLIAVIISCYFFLARSGENVSLIQMMLTPGWFALALIASLFNVVTGYRIWLSILVKKSGVEKQAEDYLTYTVSLLSRYLPGGKIFQFLPFVGSQTEGRSPLLLSFALSFTMVTGIIAGFWLAALGGFLKEGWQNGIFSVGCLAASAVAFFVFTNEEIFSGLKNVLPKFKLTFSLSDLARFSALQFFGAWMAEGVAIFAILSSLHISVSYLLFGELFWAYVVASIGGYLVFLTPGGIGVREGIFIALLQSKIGLANAAYLAAWQRIFLVLADFSFSLPALVTYSLSLLKRKNNAAN